MLQGGVVCINSWDFKVSFVSEKTFVPVQGLSHLHACLPTDVWVCLGNKSTSPDQCRFPRKFPVISQLVDTLKRPTLLPCISYITYTKNISREHEVGVRVTCKQKLCGHIVEASERWSHSTHLVSSDKKRKKTSIQVMRSAIKNAGEDYEGKARWGKFVWMTSMPIIASVRKPATLNTPECSCCLRGRKNASQRATSWRYKFTRT